MSEQRTQSAAGLLICQQCGVVLKTQNKTCRDCGTVTSRYSTTLIPVLVINRKPATAPQHLKPENDPLIMERVVTRCKFNEAMRPKAKKFHGSRAFFNDQTYEHAGNVAPASAEQVNVANQGVAASNQTEFDPFARTSGGQPPAQPVPAMPQTAPGAQHDAVSAVNAAEGVPQALPGTSGSAPPAVPFFDENSARTVGEQTAESGSIEPASNNEPGSQRSQSESSAFPFDEAPSQTTSSPTQSAPVQNPAQFDYFAEAPVHNDPGQNNSTAEVPFNAPNQSMPGQNEPRAAASGIVPAKPASDEKVVRQAHPSYMVADSFLLVVQEHDGKTLSLTQFVDGPEQEPVFGLLPAPNTFNICSSQVMPDGSVSLSGDSLSFHDANKEEEFSAAPEVDTSINIDSRLAFEEGLSRVAALRLQGALSNSGVIGFEKSSSDEDLRKKFTRKPSFVTPDRDEVTDMGTTDDVIATPPKLKERSVFNPKKASDVEKLEKIESIGDIKPISPKKNPLAMVGAVIGIIAVLGVVGFVGLQKFSEFSAGGGSQSVATGTTLPKQWHIVLSRTADVKTIYQDFQMQVDQSGDSLSGKGRDAIGDFTLTGELKKDGIITLQKSYDTAGYIWPIVFSGKVGAASDGSFASGSYVWRKSDQERVQGEWQATLPMAQNAGPQGNLPPTTGNPTPPVTPDQVMPGQYTGGQFKGTKIADWPRSTPTPGPGIVDSIIAWFGPRFSTEWFTKAAWVSFASLVSVGGLTYVIFYTLFSPNGKLNRLEKEKYIPSQFRREHARTLSSMSRRLKPGGLPLGKRVEWRWWKFWTSRNLSFTPELREDNPNLLLLGASGRGKTRLMSNMVAHDILSNDRAVVIIDSDGTLSELIVDWMSSQPNKKELLKRTIAIDPTREGRSLTYNPLQTPDPANMQTAASCLVHGFKAIYAEPPGSQTAWNQQTANILRNAAVLLMVNERTLVDLPTLLQDNDFRDIMLERVERLKDKRAEYVTLLEAWANYKKLARTDQWINWVEPILNRITPVLSDPRLRPILTAPHSELSLESIVENKKILIVKLPQGELDQNASLLGSLIVTGVQQAAMTLKRKKKSVTRRVSLYLDDLDTFVEQDTLENLAQEFRRYQISVTGSLKTLQHLQEDYRNKLVVNIHTYCVFSLAKKDADILGGQIFRVDGRKSKGKTLTNHVNPINSVQPYEMIVDEEKLNVDRLVGQAKQTFFCYSFGSVASVFQLRADEFPKRSKHKPDEKLAEMIYGVRGERNSKTAKVADKALLDAAQSRSLSVTGDDESESEPRNGLNFDLKRAYY